MSEEEILKECTELAENEHHELGDCWDEEYSSSAIFELIMLYKQTKKELNNLKEIEKSHKEENGKLRVELEQEKEKNNELEIELSTRDNINVDKLVEKYKYYRRLADSYQANCISKDKIKEKYLEMEQEYARKVYDNNYNRTEVKKEEMYKRQVYEELLEEK